VVAVGGWDGTVGLWDARTGTQLGSTLHGKSGVASEIAFSPDGRRLLARGSDGLTMWNLENGRELPAPRSDSASDLGAWLLPGGRAVATVGHDGNLAVTDERSPATQLGSPLTEEAGEAAFAPHGGLLGAIDRQGVIRFWSTSSWRPSGPPIATGLAGAGFAYSQDGRQLVAWNTQAGRAATWDLATRRLQSQIDGTKGDQLFFDAHDRVLAVAHGYEDARVIGAASEGSTLQSSPDTTDAELDPSGRTMMLSTLWGTGVWDLRSGRRTSAWFPSGATAWNPARGLLATGERDGTLEVWDIRTGALLSAFRSLPAPLAVRFSRDGDFLAVLGDGLQIWDLARQSLLGSRSFSDDPAALSNGVANLDFSPAGDALVASGPNGELVRWTLDSTSWVRLACRLANRPLTRAEWRRFVGARPYAPACHG
jgi:WD40 repeat protein